MTHYLGRLVSDNRTFTDGAGLDLTPSPAPLGGSPRFVILHFDNVSLSGSAQLVVPLGYGTDVFKASSGSDFWSRPVDTSSVPIQIRIQGGTGSARLHEYGSGEPSITPGETPGTDRGSQSNPDPFLHSDPYDEPTYETRLECNAGFAWQNSACSLATVSDTIRNRVAASSGIVFLIHHGHVSSCSGTLIAGDLFLTGRHCFIDPNGADVESASVTFDYQTNCDGARPSSYAPRFHKVIAEVAAGRSPESTSTSYLTDWVVLRLDTAPGALPPPLVMRDTGPVSGEVIFTMHHPNGAVKKTQENTHNGGSISGFDFAGGSSGSALFDSSGHLVGGPLCCGAGCFVSFAPIDDIKDALTNPPPPPSPLDVMLVFDRSGSMDREAPPAGRPKLEEAQDAASLFVQLVREGAGDRLGLATFSSNSDLVRAPTAAASAKPALVGPPPFTAGDIGNITAGGFTSIGAGVQEAIDAMASGTNDRAILLLSDGLENRNPRINTVEGGLGATKLCVVGFGSDAEIDGPLLNRIAREHRGQFTRAIDGLSLRKFYGLCFGDIFETGALADPEQLLAASQKVSDPHSFHVCGEERITVVLGWDNEATPLRAHIHTPSGKRVSGRYVRPVRGRNWAFWRIKLPYENERDGVWKILVDRVPTGGEFPPPPTDVRYFFLVICSGGPKMVNLGMPSRVYTGDSVLPQVALHYANRTAPDADVQLIIDAPTIALGQLVTDAGLKPPQIDGDVVDAFHATLQSIATQSGNLPVGTTRVTVPLFDDGAHEDGALEPDGIYANRIDNLTQVEGTYEFRAVARYGDGCTATREVHWALHVEPGIAPEESDVDVRDVSDVPGGHHGTVVIFPRDRFRNPLGPGRRDGFSVAPIPGVTITGEVVDFGDGSYGVDVTWDSDVTLDPGIVVQQPERDPVVLTPPSGADGQKPDCRKPAQDLVECLGLSDEEVKRVKVKSVCVQIDLKDKDC